jgi:hypothetical protein
VPGNGQTEKERAFLFAFLGVFIRGVCCCGFFVDFCVFGIIKIESFMHFFKELCFLGAEDKRKIFQNKGKKLKIYRKISVRTQNLGKKLKI